MNLADGDVLHNQFQQGDFLDLLAKWLGVNQKTAWKIGHAICTMMAVHADVIRLLSGVVELDEKYLGGKPRLQHGVKYPRGKGTKKTCVHVAISRKGAVRTGVVTSDSYAVLAPYVKQVVSSAARAMTDQLHAYMTLGKEFSGHQSVTVTRNTPVERYIATL